MRNIFKLTQFKKNVISGSIVHGLNILVVFLSYPIYIKYLGFELFSVWTVLSVVISFAKMGEFGIGKAVIVFVAKADKDGAEIRRITFNSIYIMAFTSLIMILLLVLFKANIVNFLNIPSLHLSEAINVIPYIGISIALYLFYDIFSGVIVGLDRLDIGNILLLSLNITKVLISVALLSLGYSIKGLVYSIIISNTLFIIIEILIIIFKFKIPLQKFVNISKKHIKNLLGFGSSIIGIQVFNMLCMPLAKVVISNTINVEAVGVFELAQKSGYALRAFFEKGLFAIMPKISNLSSNIKNLKESKIEVHNTVAKFTKYLIYFAIPFFIIMSASAPIWLRLWLGENFKDGILYGYWLLQPGIIFGLIALPAYYALMGTNNQQKCFIESVIRGVLVLALISLFFIIEPKISYSFVIISLSVIISNAYILIIFNKKYNIKSNAAS